MSDLVTVSFRRSSFAVRRKRSASAPQRSLYFKVLQGFGSGGEASLRPLGWCMRLVALSAWWQALCPKRAEVSVARAASRERPRPPRVVAAALRQITGTPRLRFEPHGLLHSSLCLAIRCAGGGRRGPVACAARILRLRIE